jgi:hypothetical protein
MPNEKGNRYAIHTLKDRRATMAGEIVQMKEGISYREEQLCRVDSGNQRLWQASIDALTRRVNLSYLLRNRRLLRLATG